MHLIIFNNWGNERPSVKHNALQILLAQVTFFIHPKGMKTFP